ncbi:MAG: peptidoglycan D,D-transpeptidase FtsI family protein [Shimia sp.]
MSARTPRRPLARIMRAREAGEDPAAIERENIRLRQEVHRDKARARAEGRLFVLCLLFLAGFATIGARIALLAVSAPSEPQAVASTTRITAQRADIVDRDGRLLATNFDTHALYAQTKDMVDPARAAKELVAIFPDLDEDRLRARFERPKSFHWVKTRISPEQKQAVHDIGEPGLLFGPREMRLYPNGAVAAHVLGGATFGDQAVYAAEVVGVAGIEARFDEALRDPGRDGAPLRLSLDLRVQAAVEELLYGGMRLLNAKGAAAVLMRADTGEVIALASLPDFDPNDRPAPLTEGDQADSPLFNRAVQGLYELGSAYKIFTVAQAMELGLLGPDTPVDTSRPLRSGGHEIGEFRNKDYGPTLTATEVIVKSSNVGTARIVQQIGGARQRDFLGTLGLLEPTPIELLEAPKAQPLLPARWVELSSMTISYGHGISTSPLHLAAAYASLLNGGHEVKPTLLATDEVVLGPRVVSERVSAEARAMLRAVVGGPGGTASMADVAGYRVGGKTGTADKPKPTGGYWTDRTITTFASVFPTDAPEYVLVVTLDEPQDTSGSRPRRTAGWTAVPIAAEIVRRAAPLLGLRPEVEAPPLAGITPVSGE